ncbi:MAG: hypothetical protein ACR2PT_10480 [Endozoicomonas sp.]
MQRALYIRERFQFREKSISIRKYSTKEADFVAKTSHDKRYQSCSVNENISIKQGIASFIFDDHESSSEPKTAFQDWLINEDGENPGGESIESFGAYFRQEIPFVRNREDARRPALVYKWPQPVNILTPFSHYRFKDKETIQVDTGKIISDDGIYLFPMDWQHASFDSGGPTGASATISVDLIRKFNITISSGQLRVYERNKGVLKKEDEPRILQRYDFVPETGNMKLTIWGQPDEFEPWGWEYRETVSPARGVRYLRVIQKGEELAQVEKAEEVPVKTKCKVTSDMADQRQHPAIPVVKKIGETVIDRENGIGETMLGNLIPSLIWLLSVPRCCQYVQHRDALSF